MAITAERWEKAGKGGKSRDKGVKTGIQRAAAGGNFKKAIWPKPPESALLRQLNGQK